MVVSNNDGGAIARSIEPKTLAIGTDEPWFKIQQRHPEAGLIALGANLTLYGDMSNRIMGIAADHSASLESRSRKDRT